jgi:hypothetical protein
MSNYSVTAKNYKHKQEEERRSLTARDLEEK